MSTRSGRTRASFIEVSPPRTRKGVSPTRSPARTRKSSPPSRKSPPPARLSGRKSPARKSPSRKPASKFPARKSPSRATKEITEPVVPKSPAKRPIDSEVVVRLQDFSSNLEVYRSTRSKRLDYSVKDINTSLVSDDFSNSINGLESDLLGLRNRRIAEEVTPRRSSRLREFIDNKPDIQRSASKSISHSHSFSKSISKSIDTYSDEENSEEDLRRDKSRSVTRKLATPLPTSISYTQAVSKWEFGGRIGSALLILFLPVTVFFIIISCQNSCSVNLSLDLSEYKSIKIWFSLQSLGFLLAQLVLQAIFTVLPIFGTKSDKLDDTGIKYCFNAFFSSIFTVNLLFLLDYFLVLNKDSMLNGYLRLATISYVFAVILSVILFFKSNNIDNKDLNPYGNTGYILYDFFMGREIHPVLKNLDVKVWISRICNINCIILLSLIFSNGLQIKLDEKDTLPLDYKEFLSKVQLQPTILIFSMMQIIYILNFIIREHKITTTFFWHSEGVGYLQIVASALYPFYFTSICKYMADAQLVLSTNMLISASILFMLGFTVMLVSNNIKYEFRTNPLHFSLANVDSMPTFHGKKLLVSGMWGMLRHPNYAGDILMHIALSLPGILSKRYVASLPALLTILVLIHRAWRDHNRCKRRYGAAWQRYCKRVPSIIIPKVL